GIGFLNLKPDRTLAAMDQLENRTL
ncbi:MAG: hypothetical protein ACI8PZ_002243, partial [Myxococcota bacterium]